MKKFRLLMASLATTLLGTSMMPLAFVHAASTVVVTPTSTQGWSTADTRTNGHVSFVNDMSAPLGSGALSLVTDASPAPSQDKAQYLHAANTPLSNVNDLAYQTKQNSASFNNGAPSYQLLVCLTGDTSGTCNANATPVEGNSTSFTTFVYEPYNNGQNITQGVWQSWDVDQGQMWSSRNANCATGSVAAGGGGSPFYTLSALKSACPNATVIGFGVNIGSNNPGYNTEADALVFNQTTYDFELTSPFNGPTSKDSCKNDGWKNFTDPSFKNQGQCVSFVETEFKRTKTYELNSNNEDGLNIPTVNGVWYKVTLAGTWTNRGGEVVDAECTSWQGGPWLNAVNGGFSPDLLDVQVNQSFVNWGSCDSVNHTYTKMVKANGTSMNLRVFDGDTNTNQQNSGWFGDNVGSFDVKVVSYAN